MTRTSPTRLLRLVLVLLPVLAVAASCSSASAERGTQRPRTYPVYDQELVKAQLAEKLRYAPHLVIVGGSRALRFDPGYIAAKTGVDGFNGSIRMSTPMDTYAMVRYISEIHPEVLRFRYLWLIHIDLLRGIDKPSPSLVQNWRFRPYWSPDYVDWQWKLLPTSPGAAAEAERLQYTGMNFAADGHLQQPREVLQSELRFGIHNTIAVWARRRSLPVITARPQAAFERTLGLMNRLGAKPVLVFMPVHPEALKVIGPNGYFAAKKELFDYLRSLQGTYQFTLFDFNDIRSFGGDPNGFYDGQHPDPENTYRIVNEILRRQPHIFD